VAALIAKGSTPGLFESLAEACGPVELSPFDELEAGEEIDRFTTCFAAEVIRRQKPNLLLVHLLDADHLQHFLGPDASEALHTFEVIDAQIGALRRATREAGIADRSVFVIVGDHGFVPVHTSVNVDALLLAAGFATVGEEANVSLAPEVRAEPLGGSCAFYVQEQEKNDAALARRLEPAIGRDGDRLRRGGPGTADGPADSVDPPARRCADPGTAARSEARRRRRARRGGRLRLRPEGPWRRLRGRQLVLSVASAMDAYVARGESPDHRRNRARGLEGTRRRLSLPLVGLSGR
jgi:hypothetical protein